MPSSSPSGRAGSTCATSRTHNVGDGLNKALAALEEENTGLEGVLHHMDFTRTLGKSKLPDKKLRELIAHFNSGELMRFDRVISNPPFSQSYSSCCGPKKPSPPSAGAR